MSARERDSRNEGNPADLVHNPAQLATNYVKFAEELATQPGIQFGIPAIDAHMLPMRPGNLIVITARPGHCKTSLMAWLARHEAERLRRTQQIDKCVVYVTAEQTAEELEAFFQSAGRYSVTDLAWGRVPLDVIRQGTTDRAGLPLWVIGDSIFNTGKKVPRLFPDIIYSGLEGMSERYGVRPSLICMDYAQLFPVRDASERVQQVTEVPVQLKEVGKRVGAAVVLGAQAKQEVDDSAEKIPQANSPQWASSIHQASDKHLAAMRPSLYYELGTPIRLAGQPPLTVTENLLILRKLKERFNAGRHTWLMHFAPEYLKLSELETRKRNVEEEAYAYD